jgi:hypothetical protein
MICFLQRRHRKILLPVTWLDRDPSVVLPEAETETWSFPTRKDQ